MSTLAADVTALAALDRRATLAEHRPRNWRAEARLLDATINLLRARTVCPLCGTPAPRRATHIFVLS